jgi:hypothetical protein
MSISEWLGCVLVKKVRFSIEYGSRQFAEVFRGRSRRRLLVAPRPGATLTASFIATATRVFSKKTKFVSFSHRSAIGAAPEPAGGTPAALGVRPVGWGAAVGAAPELGVLAAAALLKWQSSLQCQLKGWFTHAEKTARKMSVTDVFESSLCLRMRKLF